MSLILLVQDCDAYSVFKVLQDKKKGLAIARPLDCLLSGVSRELPNVRAGPGCIGAQRKAPRCRASIAWSGGWPVAGISPWQSPTLAHLWHSGQVALCQWGNRV